MSNQQQRSVVQNEIIPSSSIRGKPTPKGQGHHDPAFQQARQGFPFLDRNPNLRFGRGRFDLVPNPFHDYIHNICYFVIGQGFPFLYSMTPFDTTPAACFSCMLCNKYRMPFHRGLFAIVFWGLRGNTGVYEIISMVSDSFDAFIFDV